MRGSGDAMAGEKLSMTAFMQLRRSRQVLEEARERQEKGQDQEALRMLEQVPCTLASSRF